jgi:hypothetical protein
MGLDGSVLAVCAGRGDGGANTLSLPRWNASGRARAPLPQPPGLLPGSAQAAAQLASQHRGGRSRAAAAHAHATWARAAKRSVHKRHTKAVCADSHPTPFCSVAPAPHALLHAHHVIMRPEFLSSVLPLADSFMKPPFSHAPRLSSSSSTMAAGRAERLGPRLGVGSLKWSPHCPLQGPRLRSGPSGCGGLPKRSDFQALFKITIFLERCALGPPPPPHPPTPPTPSLH